MKNRPKRVAVICIDNNDFMNWKNQQGHQPDLIDSRRKYQVGNIVYYGISEPCDLCSLSIDEIKETHDAYLNPKYNEMMEITQYILIYPSEESKTKEKTKPTAEEFLKSKGWDDKNPIIGGAMFKGIAELLEEYARLQPFDPDTKRFPSEQEIDSMADKYTDGEIYVYAGVNMVKEWLKGHGLLL